MEQMYFYILLIVALLLIAGLAVAVVYYRRKLDKCMTALVRCINENFEMKEKLLKFNYVYTPYTADLTPREFTRIIHNMLKRLMFLPILLLFVVCNVHAGEKPDTIPVATEAAKPYTLSLRANLLRWATLTPDLGLEWRINRNVGIVVNGSWTSWSWDDKNRRYALWEVSPEVRYYIGKEKRGYIGAMYHAGQFNYKLNDTGKQGDLMGGGLTGGYSLKLNHLLSMDFSLGVGCTHADYEKYTVTDGVRIRQSKEKKNYWGVNHAGITLVWKLK